MFPNPSYESFGHLKKTDDCNKLCPVHKKSHALLKCRAFREKPIEERKMFLKEKNNVLDVVPLLHILLNIVRPKSNVLNAAMRITT